MTESTVLFVDDEAAVLSAMRRIFRKTEVNVLVANSGAEGLRIMETHSVNVVVSDQRMPSMSGTQFLKAVRDRYPHTLRCILSGYAEMEAVVAAINDGHVYRFIAKPWDDADVRDAVTECLDVAIERAAEHVAKIALHDKAAELESKNDHMAKLVTRQESLLASSRSVLDQLPVSLAVLDALGRVIYTNRSFVAEFGHLPGVALGGPAGEHLARAAQAPITGETQLRMEDTSRHAHLSKIEIGEHVHTLITISPDWA